MARVHTATNMGLPIRSFLYTFDQIATLLELSEDTLKKKHIFYFGRQPGFRPRDKMMARNLSAPGDRPEWRVAEQELIRWMRIKGFKVYQQDWILE